MSQTTTPPSITLPTPTPTPTPAPLYASTGWTGTVAAMGAALTALGYTLNADRSLVWDGKTDRGNILALSQYRVMDAGTSQEAAIVLVRTATGNTPTAPTGLTVMSPDTTSSILGTYMGDVAAVPTISAEALFDRLTDAEHSALVTAAYQLGANNPTPDAVAAGLCVGLSNGFTGRTINLTDPIFLEWAGLLQTEGILTPERYAVFVSTAP